MIITINKAGLQSPSYYRWRHDGWGGETEEAGRLERQSEEEEEERERERRKGAGDSKGRRGERKCSLKEEDDEKLQEEGTVGKRRVRQGGEKNASVS
ncbi:hypothetical protein E2C01_081854 [Portunus trituberculatus]|uniref:Uncharacterized protein n=1 Tax=Portunus trituberculatus TaxID=210409 RepID=A0A5B7IZ81_PORTR|nr:hypothetical protein [Portunus trituberculatus]